MLGRLVGAVFSRARGGSQRGGDGGVRGGGGRNLIYEAKRYEFGTDFDDRSIRGEIDEAVERNPSLEAWILVSTRDVPEQTLTAMEAAARPRGIETLVVDWLPARLPRLAALCASAPEALEGVVGKERGGILAKIRSSEHYEEVLDSLRESVRDAAVGFDFLREASHSRIREVWASIRTAESRFGQNVAGGDARASHIRRPGPMAGLDAWDLGALGSRDELALVVGREGMGKTWAVVDWLQARLDRLPIVVLAPSTTLGAPITGRSALVAFIARCLRDLDRASERNEEYWEGRVARLLQRPREEGAALMLFFDGLNEEPSYSWHTMLNQLQDEPFYGRIRVLASARNSFVEERLGDFREWAWKPTRIEVGPYDDTPDGEFDKRLDAAGLTREDLPTTLFELAQIPRLFDLVIRLRDRLGGVDQVTVHRLFWEYGAMALRANAFGPIEWRAFVLRLASEFLQGRKRQPRGRMETLGGWEAVSADAVYRRISTIEDSAFAQTGDWGDVEFEADFVRHALGLALVRDLDGKSGAAATEALEQFFDPLNEHDEEAEIVRAAVSVALAKGGDGLGALLVKLCGRWVRCQNLPESHLVELAGLAVELIEPLLEVIEATRGHAESSPRYRAVNALDKVDHSDARVARAIAKRGARWLRWMSQERGMDGAGAESERARRRRKRLGSRIGTGDAGFVTVLGQEVEIVAQADEGLGVAAVQLLQGRPLVEAIEFFEAGALQLAICGDAREEHGWLNMLNDVDPAETAERLRERSEAMLQRQPEDGVHAQLNERVAAILLWRTGYEEDAQRALKIEPGLDRFTSYTENYEADPAKSWFGLERRHVVATLRRDDVPLRMRIERAVAFLVDPSLEVPREFVREAIQTAHGLNWDNIAIGRSTTAEDLTWRDLSRVLARFAPNELARLERERQRGFAVREGEARFGAARTAPQMMLLVGEAERDALHALRERVPEEPDKLEWFTNTQLLIAEVQGEGAANQVRRIASAGLDGVETSLARACGSPTSAELEDLVEEYRYDPNGLLRVAEFIDDKAVTLGERAFEAFSGLLFEGAENRELGPVWLVLGVNAPIRLGAMLDERGWAWSGEKPYMENVMGSMAVAAANREASFDRFATRLAPMAVLPVVADRGASREEVVFAVELVSSVVMHPAVPVPETPLEVSHDRNEAEVTGYLFSFGDIREKDEIDDVARFISRTREDYQERRQGLANNYFEEVMDARRRGANFHLESVQPEHLGLALDWCTDTVDDWLNGMSERSPAFVRRVQMANGFFVPLCEALLVKRPSLGVELWRALNDCMTHVKFTVHGDMDRMVEALFASECSASVEQELEGVYGLDGARTDRELVTLVVAARRHGRLAWLREMVVEDEASQCPLRRRRASFLGPLLTVPEVAGDDGWPQGEFAGGVRGASWKLGQREAFAHHWLRTFAKARSEAEAHASWQLFLACVDRRTWSWFTDVLVRDLEGDGGLDVAKRRFVVQQKREIRRAIAENEKHWGENYAHRRYPRALRPWNE